MDYTLSKSALVVLAICLTAAGSDAQQLVTLRSGTTLEGKVLLDGESAKIMIGGSEIAIPFNSIASVAPADSESPQRARNLLILALESRALNPTGAQEFGLLSEAYKIAPDNPRITFWYAQALVDEGFGKEAKALFDQ